MKHTFNGKPYDPSTERPWLQEDGTEKSYYENGVLAYQLSYVNGRKHGVEKEYYKNGILCYEGPYINDQKHGIEKGYHEDGTLYCEIHWVNGEVIKTLIV